MSHDLLIDRLSSQLAPVRRRSLTREAGWIAGLGALEAVLFVMAGAMRPDMPQAIAHPFMWWKLGSLAVLAAIAIATALRSFSPLNAPRRGLRTIAVLVGLAALAGLFVPPGAAVAPGFLARLSPLRGLICAGCIVVLSLPMLGMLSILMRKGASAHAEGSALAVGVAAGSWGALVFALCCPINDPLYVGVWYAVGVGVIAAIARTMLPRLARL